MQGKKQTLYGKPHHLVSFYIDIVIREEGGGFGVLYGLTSPRDVTNDNVTKKGYLDKVWVYLELFIIDVKFFIIFVPSFLIMSIN